MEGILKEYTTEDIKKRKIQLEKEIQKSKVIREILEKYFKFEISDYIIDDIVHNETYRHLCFVINLAIVNERISTKNAKTLKEGIKEIFSIEDDLDMVKAELLFNE